MDLVSIDGRLCGVVTPVKSLMRSKMVSDVVKRGDAFVVDMQTGELTITRNNTTSFNVVHTSIKGLSPALETAKSQLEFALNANQGNEVVVTNSSDTAVVMVTNNARWREDLEKLYKKHA